MKKLPDIRIVPVPDWQKDRLARWLQEWKIDRILRETPKEYEDAGAIENLKFDISPTNAEPSVTVGQIRLLYPNSLSSRSRPLYVAVLRELEPDIFLAAPYSRFSEPAVTGELLTGREPSCLRVLCLWNAHETSEQFVKNSWVVEELSEKEMKEARTVLSNIETDEDLPPELEKRVGPPIQHPQDPRIEYQAEEAALMADVLRQQIRTPSEGKSILFPYVRECEQHRELAMAAESRAMYGTKTVFHVQKHDVFLQIADHSDPRQCTVLVVDKNCEPSEALDGYVLQSATGTRSSPISKVQVVVSLDLIRSEFSLIAPGGTSFSLKRVK